MKKMPAERKQLLVADRARIEICLRDKLSLGAIANEIIRRGTNENTNGLLRQYLSGYAQVELDAVVKQLNDRLRKTPSFAIPKEAFSRLLAELNNNLQIKSGVAYATCVRRAGPWGGGLPLRSDLGRWSTFTINLMRQ